MSALLAVRAVERAWLRGEEPGAPRRIRALLASAPEPVVAGWATVRWSEQQEDLVAGSLLRLDGLLTECAGAVDGEMGTAELLAVCLGRRFARDGDPNDLQRMIDLWWYSASADDVPKVVPLWLSPASRWLELGSALLERVWFAGADGDLEEAAAVLQRALTMATEPEIRALCLGRLAACDHEQFLRTGQRSAEQRALRRYRRALAVLGSGSPARPMLLTECGSLHQDRFDVTGDTADLQRALELGREGLATGPPQGPERAGHLVNLGTCFDQRYSELGLRADRDRALDCWRDALAALPAGSPYHATFTDRLVLGLVRRWEERHDTGDLDEAIRLGREAVAAGARSPDAPVFANHLADALAQRWRSTHDLTDLDEAIGLLRSAVQGSRDAAVRTPDLAANLVQLSVVRYEAVGDPADLDAALVDVDLSVWQLDGGHRGTVAAAYARLFLARYRLRGDVSDLTSAVLSARRSVAGLTRGATVRAARMGYLAGSLFLRYQALGRRRDLDAAIKVSLAAVEDEATAAAAAVAGMLHDVRYGAYGDPADGRAAVHWARAAVESERAADIPFFAQGLAVVLHGRFEVGGRFADLDEAVRRQRATLRRLRATAPDLSLVLSNFGIALQDRYEYRGTRRDLAAAVAAHEEALATCPERSPERAGLLHTLAAALKARFERSGKATDLARVVELNEQAVATLPPSSPERTAFHANLAAAYSLRARRTATREHTDAAVRAFAIAARRLRPGQPLRPAVLHGYATALAERFDRFGGPRDRARASTLHRRAVSTSQPIPVLRLDIALAWGEWSARHGMWLDAVAAYRAAGQARRELVGVQYEAEDKAPWLGRAAQLHPMAAMVLVRTGDLAAAAAALEDGRALLLAESLDLQTVAARLCRVDRSELAARFSAAAGRVGWRPSPAVPDRGRQ